MVPSERFQQALARRRRAEERPRYLERVKQCTGRALRDEDLLSDDEVNATIVAHQALVEKTRAERTERRTPGLSAQEAQDVANRLAAAIEDRVMVLGCGGSCPAHARVRLHEVLGALSQYMAIGGYVGLSTEDGSSNLAIDLLMPGDYDNRHPEGSYEFILRGPLFEGIELPGLFTVGVAPQPG